MNCEAENETRGGEDGAGFKSKKMTPQLDAGIYFVFFESAR